MPLEYRHRFIEVIRNKDAKVVNREDVTNRTCSEVFSRIADIQLCLSPEYRIIDNAVMHDDPIVDSYRDERHTSYMEYLKEKDMKYAMDQDI
jgi:hypothetical protein